VHPDLGRARRASVGAQLPHYHPAGRYRPRAVIGLHDVMQPPFTMPASMPQRRRHREHAQDLRRLPKQPSMPLRQPGADLFVQNAGAGS